MTLPAATLIHLKVVPGSSRTDLAGRHGDRFRLRVSAPPEGGKANAAVIRWLADRLGLARRQLTIVRGQTSPLKTVAVAGLTSEEVEARLDP